MKLLKTYIEDFWFLLYPHTCEACGMALNKNEGIICFKCLYDLPRTDYCEFIENPITELFAGRLKIERGTALFTFHKGSRFRKLLHSLKYKNKPSRKICGSIFKTFQIVKLSKPSKVNVEPFFYSKRSISNIYFYLGMIFLASFIMAARRR